jgi:hypothetical protein
MMCHELLLSVTDMDTGTLAVAEFGILWSETPRLCVAFLHCIEDALPFFDQFSSTDALAGVEDCGF